MEHASPLPALPSLENLRRGQREVVEKFLAAPLGSKPRVNAKLPTGYGKTLTASTSFATLFGRGMVDYLLFVVPREAQAEQAGEAVPKALERYGIHTRSCVVGYHRNQAERELKAGTSRVFIVTIQSLIAGQTMSTLLGMMTKGRWMVVADEYHHYGQDGKWTERLKTLPASAFLAMSATPDREGEAPVFGPPDVSVTYLSGVNEGALTPLKLEAYDYRIDAVKVGGETFSFTTAELQDKAGSRHPDDIERFMAAREMRWSAKFVSPLVSTPIDRMIDMLACQNVRTQMLVQALCCSHAKVVCEQIASLVPEGMTVDWVGTGLNGRSDEENHEILQRFCPTEKKDGVRVWSLQILVNVGMAGEGLDTTDVKEVVLLTNARGTNTDMQIMGRAARKIALPPDHEGEVFGTINVDAGCQLAQHYGQRIMRIFDTEKDLVDEAEEVSEPVEIDAEYKPLPTDPIVAVTDVHFLDIKKDPLYQAAFQPALAKVVGRGFLEEVAREAVEKALIAEIVKRDARYNIGFAIERGKERLESQVHHVGRLATKILSAEMGLSSEAQKRLRGDVYKRINAAKKRRFGAVKDCTQEELEAHKAWLLDFEAMLLRGEIPAWMR
jgi:superfamily II DNA or RNA helicase